MHEMDAAGNPAEQNTSHSEKNNHHLSSRQCNLDLKLCVHLSLLGLSCLFVSLFFKTRSYVLKLCYAALALELSMPTRLSSNSEICLSLLPKCWY